MKKDIYVFALNIILILSLTAGLTAAAPHIAGRLGFFSRTVAMAFSPVYIADGISKNILSGGNKNGAADNTNNTASEAGESPDRNIVEDGDIYSHITDTPEDIKLLMNKAEKTVKKEKKSGKTTEEDYFGGGTLVSFGDLEIQSKIPSSFYKFNIQSLLNQKAELSIEDMSNPTVLVYHSHTTESYSLLDAGYYTESLALRSKELDRTVVRAGDDLCLYLRHMGFNVIHDREIHDSDYNSSYAHSRRAVEKYLEQYPSIDVTIDVHRDDITYKDKTKVKPTATVSGKKAARMMLIAGAEYGSVKNFTDWEENLRFCIAVQNKVNKMYPGLMRPILFAERKYNMDETPYSFLLEIGTDANTLDEACYSARLFATAFGELLTEEYVK
jgi:stage II sporulation protein P